MKTEYEPKFAVLEDANRPQRERLAVVRELGATRDPELIPELLRFLKRPHPPDEDYIDYDPRVPERLLDIAAVGALHKLGDDSQWDVLIDAIPHAASGVGPPPSEVELIGETVNRIGDLPLLDRVVELCGDARPVAVANAVKTLVAMSLPGQPTHQHVHGIPSLTQPIEVTVARLSTYLNGVASASNGAVVLSPGVREYLLKSDYQVSDGRTEKTTAANVLTQTVRLHNLAYYVERDSAVICTFAEAGQRWQAWWKVHRPRLEHNPQLERFGLKE